MIGATAAALQEQPVWGYLVWGLPTALVLATVWTHFRLSSLSAEIHLRPGQVAIQSIQDILRGQPLDWHALNNVQVSPGELEISVGWSTEICRPRDWPNYRRLRESAQHAFRSHTSSSVPE
jgi:hypothetical protein